MLLEGKIAIVYGAGGHIGGAVARAFAADGATVYLAGRTFEKVRRVADAIKEAGGKAEAAEVDALDRQAIEDHLAAVVEKAGGVDITFNAIGIRGDLQGTPLTEMTLEDFALPVEIGISTHFLTATAAARHMMKKGSGPCGRDQNLRPCRRNQGVYGKGHGVGTVTPVAGNCRRRGADGVGPRQFDDRHYREPHLRLGDGFKLRCVDIQVMPA